MQETSLVDGRLLLWESHLLRTKGPQSLTPSWAWRRESRGVGGTAGWQDEAFPLIQAGPRVILFMELCLDCVIWTQTLERWRKAYSSLKDPKHLNSLAVGQYLAANNWFRNARVFPLVMEQQHSYKEIQKLLQDKYCWVPEHQVKNILLVQKKGLNTSKTKKIP